MALVLVTGATGKLGSLVARALIARGDTVRAVVRPLSSGTLPQGAEKFEHDLGPAALPATAFDGVGKVVHCAGLVGSHPYDSLVLANAFSAKHLLANCPAEIEKVVMISSISVYGEHKGQLVDETFATACESPYGKSKLLGETFAREYASALPIVLLRLGMIYGPDFEDGYFQILDRLAAGKMQILGDGNNRMPLVHQSDAVHAIMLALDSGEAITHCREYNIVGSEQMTQKELLLLAASQLGVPAPEKSAPVILASAGVAMQQVLSAIHLCKNPSVSPENIRQLTLDRAYSGGKAKAELGFEPQVKIAEGMKEVIAAYLAKRRPPSPK
ncbi:MAG: NAD-dependent epimerase/dehydratase family protein [Candidatus Micrarchaeia archaeon]